LKWNKRGAEQGHAVAQVNLAVAYRFGYGVPSDLQEAVRWYQKAAENGNPMGMNGYGYALLTGNGIARDPVAAASWLLHAAEHGQPNAMHTMATLYFEGTGVARDPIEAAKWILLALNAYPAADEKRPAAAEFLDLAMNSLTGEEAAEARRRASAWRAKVWEPAERSPAPPFWSGGEAARRRSAAS
ncbi:MAG: sel1 repeat family protein, partial [Alphaproteobacteria bacterium]|nr:sel1 repeat family protein [Alphaproteobacteria bacterium]